MAGNGAKAFLKAFFNHLFRAGSWPNHNTPVYTVHRDCTSFGATTPSTHQLTTAAIMEKQAIYHAIRRESEYFASLGKELGDQAKFLVFKWTDGEPEELKTVTEGEVKEWVGEHK